MSTILDYLNRVPLIAVSYAAAYTIASVMATIAGQFVIQVF